MTERRRCACRLLIDSEPDAQAIEAAVQAHQKQPEHRDFAALEQLAGRYVARQSVPLTLRKVS